MLSIASALAAGAAVAAPFRPASDDQVLERLPIRRDAPAQQSLAELRARQRAAPHDAALAAELAHAWYRLAQREGDPRYVGYAQVVLAPWQGVDNAPTGIRLVRALLAQFMHQFPAAERDLDAVLAREAGHPAALSYRAILRLVQARFDEAAADCDALAARLQGLVVAACAPTVHGVTGRAAAAYAQLTAALLRHPAAPINERLWVLLRLAENADRLGRPADAEAHFRAALALGIRDQYLLASYAEFLLDHDRAAEVIPLLAGETRNEVLLLRLALSEQRTGHPDAAAHRDLIATRIAAARMRGDELHLSDEARYELDLRRDAPAALALALRNWASGQREPADARLLLEAALAAGQPDAARPALQWLDASGHEDRRLRAVAARLRGSGAPPSTERAAGR